MSVKFQYQGDTGPFININKRFNNQELINAPVTNQLNYGGAGKAGQLTILPGVPGHTIIPIALHYEFDSSQGAYTTAGDASMQALIGNDFSGQEYIPFAMTLTDTVISSATKSAFLAINPAGGTPGSPGYTTIGQGIDPTDTRVG